MALYTTDSIRRVLLECVIPYLLHWLSPTPGPQPASSKSQGEGQGHKGGSGAQDDVQTRIAQEVNKDDLELFDDYLEMVMEFGYITLFASAFPLAAALSIVCNLIGTAPDCPHNPWG